MIEAAVPEQADGGYWYVTEAVPDAELGGQTAGDIPGAGWCAWYFNGLVVIRTPDLVDGVNTASPETVGYVLSGAGYSGKPFGRIWGA